MFSVSFSSSIFVQAVCWQWHCGFGHGLHTGWARSCRGFPPESLAVMPEPNREVIGYLTHPPTFTLQLWLRCSDTLRQPAEDLWWSPSTGVSLAGPGSISVKTHTVHAGVSHLLHSRGEQIIGVQSALRWDSIELWSIEVIFQSCQVCCCFFWGHLWSSTSGWMNLPVKGTTMLWFCSVSKSQTLTFEVSSWERCRV